MTDEQKNILFAILWGFGVGVLFCGILDLLSGCHESQRRTPRATTPQEVQDRIKHGQYPGRKSLSLYERKW